MTALFQTQQSTFYTDLALNADIILWKADYSCKGTLVENSLEIFL